METYHAAAPGGGVQPTHNAKAMKNSLLLVAVALFIGGAVWWGTRNTTNVVLEEQVTYEKALPQLSAESKAKLPAGFPKQYIFGVNPVVISADITTSTVVNDTRYFAEIHTENTPEDLYNEYINFLTGTAWNISAKQEGRSIVANKGVRNLSLSFTQGVSVTILRITYNLPTP